MRVIHHTLAPHVDLGYAARSLLRILQPWSYRRGRARERLAATLGDAFSGRAFLFSSGREALLATLQAIDLRPGEEVIVPAYTCVVVPNAIIASGGIPIYVDIDQETLNLDCDVLERAITPRTRAVLCQHTFGIPMDTARLRRCCDEREILLIEDCAHVLPDRMGPREIGAHGDLLLLSFGRDKALSGIAGGAMIVRRPETSEKLERRMEHAVEVPWLRVKILLCYPLLYLLARPLYRVGVGKALLRLARALGLLIPIVETAEKQGRMSPILHRMPNACAALALGEWQRLQKMNDHRRTLVTYYLREIERRNWKAIPGFHLPGAVRADLPMQKVPLFLMHAEELRRNLKRFGIELGDGWTGCVICPAHVELCALEYTWGQDPAAEAMCQQILSLPTHPTMTVKQAARLMDVLEKELRIRNQELRVIPNS